MANPTISEIPSGKDFTVVLAEIAAFLPDLVCSESDFRKDHEIGSGGFGKVYRATHKKTGKVVALKEIFMDRLEGDRFRRYIYEIETMVHVMSPSVVSICGFSVQPPYVIASEFISGGPLRLRSRPRAGKPFKPLSPTESTIIALGVAYGLQLIHSKNILHRDLKGANILLDNHCYPHICDLGIARFDTDDSEVIKTTNLGTPTFMAPELLTGGQYDSMVDIYSYGLVVYELAERKPAIKGIKTIPELYQRLFVRKERVSFTDATSPVCRTLVERCTEFDPTQRCTATQIVEYIKSHLDTLFPGTKKSRIASYEKWAAKTAQGLSKGVHRIAPVHVFAERRPKKASAHPNPNIKSGFLTDPADPKFEEQVLILARHLTDQQFPQVLPQLIELLNPEKPKIVHTIIVEAVAQFITRFPQSIQTLVESNFFNTLPITANTAKPALDLIIDLISQAPRCITVAYIDLFTRLIEASPENTIAVLLLYWQKATWIDLSECAMLLAITDNSVPVLLSSPAAVRLLRILTAAAKKVSNFISAIANAGQIIARYLASPLDDVVISAYRFINLSAVPPDVPASLLATHLLNPSIAKQVFEYLVRIPVIPASLDLFNSLLSHSEESLAWLLLTKMSYSADGLELFLSNPSWLDKCATNPKDVLGTFLLIGSVSEVRFRLFSLPQYYPLLQSATKLKDESVCAALAVIALRGDRSGETLRRLSLEGFWQYLLEMVTTTAQSLEVQQNCVILVSAFSQVGWTDEFAGFLRHFAMLLGRDDLASSAISAITYLSYRPEGAAQIKALQMVEYLARLHGSEYYGEFADTILANVAANSA